MVSRPLPPSVTTNIDSEPVIATLSSDAYVMLAGVGNQKINRPINYSLDTDELLTHVPSNSDIATQIIRITRAGGHVALGTTAANPTFQETKDALDLVEFLDIAPTHFYPPAATGQGQNVGTLSADVAIDSTGFSLAAPPPDNRSLNGELIQIGAEIMEVTAHIAGQSAMTVVRAQEGTTAAAHTSGDTVIDLRNPITDHLELLCEEYECLAVADAPNVDVQHAVAWSDAGNTHENVMGVYNYADGFAPGGAWLATAIRTAREFGHQRGLETAAVDGVTRLAREITYSPRGNRDNDARRLVGAYLSTLIRRNNIVEILGDTFRGVTDGRRTWSGATVVHRVQRLGEDAGRRFIGLSTDSRNLRALASAVERSLRVLVNNREISGVTVIPHPEKNTPASLATGTVWLLAVVGLYGNIKHVMIDLQI